uniref:Ig-like domain-containing protein n=1 Tax=Pygocentrus nattereri TaxID=42514 RepID=A0A3B4E6V3_PYGNA
LHLLLYFGFIIYCSAQTGDLSEASFVSAESGEPVTLHCKFVEKFPLNNWVWYKQRSGQEPQEVAVKLPSRDPTLSSDSKIRFKINQHFSLTIQQTSKDDEGMYFCGKGDDKTITFSNGTFLAVRGNKITFNISVLQTPAWGSVSPGESVTLQCTVVSEIRAADLRVLWFRAAAGQSFPEIIYAHQNSSSHQCEISSSTHSSVYNFSKNNFSHSDAGTYFCAVAACGKIIVGNGLLCVVYLYTLSAVKLLAIEQYSNNGKF